MVWIDLKESIQLENEIIQKKGSHLIFKHSPRCGISSMALRRFEQTAYFKNSKDTFWIINVLLSRDISNKIAQTFSIRHESPQVLLIENGKLIHHASHAAIDGDFILKIH
ncbi:MAG: bacillithiol system redox-active protein YtxJ [Flavobacteriales bacterium]|nr:MAG: bacillithiol system redox-active protein YtxJ [Flavobacteriales bacterium]